MDAHLTPSDRNGPSTLLSVPDPTDWDDTRFPSLHPLDAALRCQICKDFYVTPVITSCFHTFCSECIRRALSAGSICPVCRATEQECRLRKNPVVEDLVDAFQAARPKLLEVAREVVVPVVVEEEERGESPPAKRRAMRSTRSAARYTGEVVDDVVEVPSPNDGLVSCPSCQKRMKEDMVNSHLDRCLQDEYKPSSSTAQPTKTSLSLRTRSSAPLPSSTPLQPLPKIAYAMINDKNLRNKLQILGIPTYGTRKNLTDRHTEWVTMWNANVDAKRPKTKAELLVELAAWERAHVRPSNQPVKAQWSDEKWQSDHDGQFKDLVAKARAGAKKKKEETAGESMKERVSKEEEVDSGGGEEAQSVPLFAQVATPISGSPMGPKGNGPALGFGPVGPHMAEQSQDPNHMNVDQHDFSSHHGKRKFNEIDGNTQVREAV